MAHTCYDHYLITLATEVSYYLINRGCSKEDAEDILQDVLIKFWVLESPLPKEKIRAWMYQVARHEFYNLHKRKTNYQRILTEFFPSSQQFTAFDLDESELLSSLLKLDEKSAELLLLKYVEELSLNEISQLLGRKITILKTELYRARRKLKTILKEEGHSFERHT